MATKAKAKAAARAPAHQRRSSGAGLGRLGAAVLVAALAAAAALAARLAGGGGGAGSAAARATAPLRAPAAKGSTAELRSEAHASRLAWGTYRPGLYVGLRRRAPQSLLAGVAWFDAAAFLTGETQGALRVRHLAEERDGLARMGWTRHDGVALADQELVDGGAVLDTTWAKALAEDGEPAGGPGGDWALRVAVRRREAGDVPPPQEGAGLPAAPKALSVIVYVADEAVRAGATWALRAGGGLEAERGVLVAGDEAGVGRWALHGADATPDGAARRGVKLAATLAVRTPHFHNLTDAFMRNMVLRSTQKGKRVVELSGAREAGANVAAFQFTVPLGGVLDVTFASGLDAGAQAAPAGRLEPLRGEALSALLAERRAAYDARFERTFGLDGRAGVDESVKAVCRAALANAVGGFGYFYGHSLVADPTGAPGAPALRYWDAPLYSMVPSRSFFPRGFLWDEGFHQLLALRWDASLSRDAIAHWLDLMNVDGWIPREQILGAEARARVPDEFVTQHTTHANPPAMMLALLELAARAEGGADEEEARNNREFLAAVFPRLEAWFGWYNRTQAGDRPGAYRWHGRAVTDRELNAKTLASGLDDYPRASHPTDDERHLDLRCWIELAARAMGRVARAAGLPAARAAPYDALSRSLADLGGLVALHWDGRRRAFADWGLHTEAVGLVRRQEDGAVVRAVRERPERGFVPHAGYVTLFPLLTGLLPADSPELGRTIEVLRGELWTPHGLRSLAQGSSMYAQRNTEHDAPYWRGAVWMNVNYLALGSLRAYGARGGPHAGAAREAYAALRAAVLRTVAGEYARRGAVFEQYGDADGAGKGTNPFTGWSALVVLVAAEEYPAL